MTASMERQEAEMTALSRAFDTLLARQPEIVQRTTCRHGFAVEHGEVVFVMALAVISDTMKIVVDELTISSKPTRAERPLTH
ncbi:hypothetical protein [Caballeronia sp. KNU42]